MTVRVLVVDDTDHVRSMLADMLALDGFEVTGQAADAESALAQVRTTPPDVVVMDLRLPGMDGVEATRALRDVSPHTHVILYTAYLSEETRARAQEAGASYCVDKSSGLVELEREVSRLSLEIAAER